MPQYNESADPPPRSRKSWNSNIDDPSQGGQFTKSKHSSTGQSACEDKQSPLNPEATDPFPPDLFRVPVPDRVFGQMAGMSDAALHCLLALVRLSWRFDPEEDTWIHTERDFSRRDVQETCGLSDQSTRDGLSELEEQGWVEIGRSERSYRYYLCLEVPPNRYTYLPTMLLEALTKMPSGAALRVVLVVIRGTWGWTETEPDPETPGTRTVHERWEKLPISDLSERTGRSESAVKTAIQAIEGKWIERRRPGHGAYHYRALAEPLKAESEEVESGAESETEKSPDPPNAKILPPHRQNSGPPSINRESCFRDKHSQPSEKTETRQEPSRPLGEDDAMPPDDQVRSKHTDQNRSHKKTSEQPPRTNLTGLSDEKRDLAEKLANVGVWAGRIAEILSRFSRARIRANFVLYRRRAAEQTIRNPGAWLYQAITDGYALPSSDLSSDSEAPDSPSMGGSLPILDHKEIVSEAKKSAYIAQGTDQERFKQCPPGPNGRRFMYFDPDGEGPNQRGPDVETSGRRHVETPSPRSAPG